MAKIKDIIKQLKAFAKEYDYCTHFGQFNTLCNELVADGKHVIIHRTYDDNFDAVEAVDTVLSYAKENPIKNYECLTLFHKERLVIVIEYK